MSYFTRCPTCLNEIKPKVDTKLSCGHLFCKQCVSAGIDDDSYFKCAICGEKEKVSFKKRHSPPAPSSSAGGGGGRGQGPSPKTSYLDLPDEKLNVINTGTEIKFSLQLCNSKGRQVPGEEYFQVEAATEQVKRPNGKEPLKLILTQEGKYEGSFTPESLGVIKLHCTLNGKNIQKSPKTIIIRPKGQLGCEIKGPLVGPRDCIQVAGSFLVTDGISRGLYFLDCLGRGAGVVGGPYGIGKEKFSPIGIASFQDYVYVSDMTNSCVVVYTGSNKVAYTSVKQFGKDFLKKPTGIAVHPVTGDIYVADYDKNKVFIFDKNTNMIKCIDTDSERDPASQINCPELMTINKAGNQLLLTDQGNCHIKVFDISGSRPCKLKRIIQTKFHSQPVRPVGIAIDDRETVYVTALHGKGGVVLVYTPEGTFVGSFGDRDLANPMGIRIVDGNSSQAMVFVSDSPGQGKKGSVKGFVL